MDPTHVSEIWNDDLTRLGFRVSEVTFYGGAFSNGAPDALFATWSPSDQADGAEIGV